VYPCSEFSHEAVKKHQETVISALKTKRDVSMRQRAVDLLYAMCDRTNSEEIVLEMLSYLETADYSIREEMVLKVAVLAEKYATDYKWYVDVILNLIRLAGDYVSEEVWYRVIQIVINRDDVQGYAAKTVFEALQAQACHENMVKVGGYILGEFGNLIAGDQRSSPLVQLQLLHSKYHLCSPMTRALLLSTYVKFINLFPEIKQNIQDIFVADSNLKSADVELQQRASEYLALSKITSLDVLATVLEEMPPFPEKESSGILNLLQKKRPGRVPENAGILNKSSSDEKKTNGGHVMAEEDLVNIGGDLGGSTNGYGAENGDQVTDNIQKFYCKNNGVLFENSLIQIGVKTECRSNLARLALFFGNKTNLPFLSFQSHITSSTELSKHILLQVKDVDSTIEAGAQFQQMVNIECVTDFYDQPDMACTYTYNGETQTVNAKLPVSVNKFMEPAEMNAEAFFTRWKNLSLPTQEAQKIFKAVFPMENTTAAKTKLIGYGFQLLENIDPNPENYVCAGIIHTRGLQIGVLLRLEPNNQAQMYRLTVRSSKDAVSQSIVDVLEPFF